MKQIEKCNHRDGRACLVASLPSFGCFSAACIARLAADPSTRLQRILVRCGGCRFVAGAQDIEHLISRVKAGGDYVRDVSMLAEDFELVKAGILPQPATVPAPLYRPDSRPSRTDTGWQTTGWDSTYDGDGPSDADPGL